MCGFFSHWQCIVRVTGVKRRRWDGLALWLHRRRSSRSQHLHDSYTAARSSRKSTYRLVYTQGDCDVKVFFVGPTISMPAVFRHAKCLSSCHHFRSKVVIGPNTDIFLNQLIQCYSNNATNLHHFTLHSTPRCPTTQRSYCDHRLLWRHCHICICCTEIRRSGSAFYFWPYNLHCYCTT